MISDTRKASLSRAKQKASLSSGFDGVRRTTSPAIRNSRDRVWSARADTYGHVQSTEQAKAAVQACSVYVNAAIRMSEIDHDAGLADDQFLQVSTSGCLLFALSTALAMMFEHCTSSTVIVRAHLLNICTAILRN